MRPYEIEYKDWQLSGDTALNITTGKQYDIEMSDPENREALFRDLVDHIGMREIEEAFVLSDHSVIINEVPSSKQIAILGIYKQTVDEDELFEALAAAEIEVHPKQFTSELLEECLMLKEEIIEKRPFEEIRNHANAFQLHLLEFNKEMGEEIDVANLTQAKSEELLTFLEKIEKELLYG